MDSPCFYKVYQVISAWQGCSRSGRRVAGRSGHAVEGGLQNDLIGVRCHGVRADFQERWPDNPTPALFGLRELARPRLKPASRFGRQNSTPALPQGCRVRREVKKGRDTTPAKRKQPLAEVKRSTNPIGCLPLQAASFHSGHSGHGVSGWPECKIENQLFCDVRTAAFLLLGRGWIKMERWRRRSLLRTTGFQIK
jgi:hypothetical protein